MPQFYIWIWYINLFTYSTQYLEWKALPLPHFFCGAGSGFWSRTSLASVLISAGQHTRHEGDMRCTLGPVNDVCIIYYCRSLSCSLLYRLYAFIYAQRSDSCEAKRITQTPGRKGMWVARWMMWMIGNTPCMPLNLIYFYVEIQWSSKSS